MKKGAIIGLLGLAFVVALGLADDLVPVAVSPGAENGPAVVRQSCPTFSWTAVSWALSYKVVVFEAGNGEAPAYEQIAVSASPVLVKEIPGLALSWTPSADAPLLNGGSYVWYVGAMANAAQGSWSEGRRFVIAEGPAWGIVSEPREERIGQGGSGQILSDKGLELTAAAKENFSLSDDFLNQQIIGVEGTEGGSNTFYGLDAGNVTMTGSSNSFFGRLAGNSVTSGESNTFVGRVAGRLNTRGCNNTFLGYEAGASNTFGANNVFVGASAGHWNNLGGSNTIVGHEAGAGNTGGNKNVFIGNQSGYTNSEGSYNTFIGEEAGYSNDTGEENTFLGVFSGWYNTSGRENVFVGFTGFYNDTGSYNTFIGNRSGHANHDGNSNVFLGYKAGYYEKGSNKLYIDNSDTAGPLIYGDFNTNILKFSGNVGIKKTPTHMLDVGTNGAYCDGGAWVDGSSREFKKNIEKLTSEEAVQAFNKLEPVKFQYKENSKGETFLGFVAEDVPDLVAMNDRKGLAPMDMVAVLTKVVQEQKKEIAELKVMVLQFREELAKNK